MNSFIDYYIIWAFLICSKSGPTGCMLQNYKKKDKISLLSQNNANKNRNERRWNRVTSTLEVAAAVLGATSATYAAINGSQGMSAGGSVATDANTNINRQTSGKNNIKITCVSCKGSDICRYCNGSGYDKNTKSGKCTACHNTGRCKMCRGKGET